MIQLENVKRSYPTLHGHVDVLKGVNFIVRPGEKVGILGKNGAGKSTMVRLISGAEQPNSGRVTRTMSVSWPLAFGGGFQGTLTGLDNLRFICRIYGQDWREHLDFIEDFTELGRFLREPLGTYSSGMRSRLAFALSMVVDFDCFLIDEIMAVGDHRFHERCNVELFEKRGHKAMIFVSHDPGFIRSACERGSVLENGVLHNFDDLDAAFTFYYRPPTADVPADVVPVETPVQPEHRDIATLLFGPDMAGEASIKQGRGDRFAEWLFAHPLNDEPQVARHRLATLLTANDFELLQKELQGRMPADLSGRSVHTALATLADTRPHCPYSRRFRETCEALVPLEGPDGLWHRMAHDAGSIRRMTTFVHAATGRELPLQVDFHRPSTPDHVRNELAEFKLLDDRVVCRLQVCMPDIYAQRLFAAYPFLLPYFAQSDLTGSFDLSLGDEALPGRVLGFSSTVPDFLVPDSLFISTGGYQAARVAYGEARPWIEREDKAYWRGTDTGAFRYRSFADAPRVQVAQLSREHPELIDAKLTNVELRPGWEAKQAFYQENGLMGAAEPQDRILDFRYQLDIDGNTNSWSGLFLKLLTGSPVLKLASELGFKQWFYGKLEPWVNFVPVKHDGSDLIAQLERLRADLAQAEAIGRRGRELALSITYDEAIAEAVATTARLVTLNQRLVPHS